MINIVHKHDCCGCNACVQRCPKQSILMHEDEEGFLYPIVDKSTCIDCGLCEKVCPVINQEETHKPLVCYAAFNPNEEVRMQSSSGGIFTMLAEKIISEGGIVFGAAWNEKWQVTHTYVEKKEELETFRGSKYVQSLIGNSFKQAELFLKAGRKVLFSGTPCQIAGLKKFLRKEYENLFTIDFICHGIPSPGVFRWYLQEELNNYSDSKENRKKTIPSSCLTSIPKGNVIVPEGLKIIDIRFRDKRTGWKKFSFVLELTEATVSGQNNLVSLSAAIDEHPFLKGFLNNYYLRPSCHICPAKKNKSRADITIADYWGYNNSEIIIDDDKGISAILISTVKGKQVFEDIQPHCDLAQYGDILRTNGALEQSAQAPYRKYFYSQKGKSFNTVITKLSSTKILNKVMRKIYLKINKNEYFSNRE